MLIMLLPIQILSQKVDRSEFNSGHLLPDRIISKSFPNEHILGTLELDIFRDKESRTIINKTILDNGFLLIEELGQTWIGSNWVNSFKSTYTYDGNNNMIEELWQHWDTSNWVNSHKHTYTFDGNNNMIEEVKQDWDGSNWVNDYKYTYTYDGNNNMIEELWQYWDASNWVNSHEATYTYDGNNND